MESRIVRTGLVDPVSLGFTAVMGVIASVSANATIKVITPQQDAAPTIYVFIALVYVLIFASVVVHIRGRAQRHVAIGFSTLATVALLVMSYALLNYADKLPATIQGTTAATLSTEIGHLSGQELSTLQEIDVTPGTKFVMDGGIDRWIYIASRTGLGFLEYSKIPIQEKGVYYLYTIAIHAFGSYSTYFFLAINWLIHIISSVLVYLISKKCFNERPALLASAIYLALPENLYFAGVLHKDVQVVFLILLYTYSTVIALYERKLLGYFLAALTLVAMAFERSGLVLPLLGSGLVAHTVGGRSVLQRLPLYLAALAIVMFTSWTILPEPVVADIEQKTVARILDKLGIGSSQHLDVGNIKYTTTKEESAVQVLGGGDLSVREIYYAPIRVVMYLLAPFPPIQPRFGGDYYIYPSAYIIAAFSVFFAIGIVSVPLNWRGPTTILALNFVLLGLALSFSGPFVYERYRLMITPFYFLIATPVVVSLTPPRSILVFGISIALWILAVLVWLWYK